MRRFLAWLGSDWRLPFIIAAAVALTFALSGGVFEFVVQTHKAYLDRRFVIENRQANEKSERDYARWIKERSPKIAGASMPLGAGL